MPTTGNNNIDSTKRVALYARVREDDGSLEQIVSELRAAAAAHGWTDPDVITEVRGSGISNASLTALSAYDVVMVWHVDRLTRSTTHAIQLLSALRDSGVSLMLADGTIVNDGPMLPVMAAVMDIVREQERAVHSERVRRGIARAKAWKATQ